MDRAQAAMLLGVEVSASVAEARGAYLLRAKILHPDRFTQSSPSEQQTATAAMAQLNHAYEVFTAERFDRAASDTSAPSGAPGPGETSLVGCPACGQANRVPDGKRVRCGACGERLDGVNSGGYSARDHFADESAESPWSGAATWPSPETACQICGFGPAKRVNFASVTGIIIWWRWTTLEAILCRECATFAYNEQQARTLMLGWWGLIAPLANVVAFVGNWIRYRSVRSMPAPIARCPSVPAVSPIPMAGSRSWYARPLAMIIASTVLVLTGWFTISVTSAPSTRSTAPSNGSTTAKQSLADASTGTTDGQVGASSALIDASYRAGDCLTDFPVDGDGLITASPRVVSCSTPHTFEVYGATDLPATMPAYSAKSIENRAVSFCFGTMFDAYFGFSLADQVRLGVSYMFPSEQLWAEGDRWITCLAYLSDASGDPLTQQATQSFRVTG